ncbi:hypothetical protein DXG01_001202 [Tephrocybe rancida]|nr:hypothetical protein DXG01_001202 [Tephrocybe rancida]
MNSDHLCKLEQYTRATKEFDETSLRWLDAKRDIAICLNKSESLSIHVNTLFPQDLCRALIQREKDLVHASALKLKVELELVKIGLAWCEQEEEVLVQDWLHIESDYGPQEFYC